ncbi:hypothetical protein SKAU_G00395350 [Synaphobranchus kaupii]|uniref:Protein kinase domain-containing protein n=1 Tax=Synaphobranchus kaupii TaxID=118154 RepID=A0A9Q1ECC8_SYNKA|nr:hypothetical protein SKAU_G00395350 [Synaphobranchus kaupii]
MLPLTLNSRTEHYDFIDELGHGVFGEVARFQRRSDRRMVAIKRLSRQDKDVTINEVRFLAALASENADEHHIVRFYESFRDRLYDYLVVEAMDQNLDAFQKRNEHSMFEIRDIRTIVLQVLIALTKLEDMGIVHADFKMDNVMLVNQRRQPFRVKLIDFGCSYTVDELSSIWTPYLQPRFVRAPEVILGLPCTVKVDMWSLGCVMGEMALGRSLFSSKNEQELAHIIFESRGLPSAEMLNLGRKTHVFFDRVENGHGAFECRLKPCTGRELATWSKRLRKRVAANLDYLDPIEDLENGVQGEDSAEIADRRCMVELLNRMLTLDPDHRISPNEALRHPFLTLQHLSSCERYGEYHNLSLKGYREAGVTPPKALLGKHEDSSEETIPEPNQEVPKKKKRSLRRSLRSFFTRLFIRRCKKQPVVAQGNEDGLEGSEDPLANAAGPSQAACNNTKKGWGAWGRKAAERQSDSTEPASSSSLEFPESSTLWHSSSPNLPECPEEPPKEKGLLRRWLSACFGGCRDKKAVAIQESNASLQGSRTPAPQQRSEYQVRVEKLGCQKLPQVFRRKWRPSHPTQPSLEGHCRSLPNINKTHCDLELPLRPLKRRLHLGLHLHLPVLHPVPRRR